MRVFFDLNVLLDVELARSSKQGSLAAINECDRQGFEGFIAWHSLSTAFYLAARAVDRTRAEEFVTDLLSIMTVASVHHHHAVDALRHQMKDFEDALQLSAAMACGADVVVTRNVSDFPVQAGIEIKTPEEFVASLP